MNDNPKSIFEQIIMKLAGSAIEKIIALDLNSQDKQFVYFDLNPKTNMWRISYTKKTFEER